jgi:hypothetical protein
MAKKKQPMETFSVNGVELQRPVINNWYDHYYVPFTHYFEDDPTKVTTAFQLYRKYANCKAARDKYYRRKGMVHFSKSGPIAHAKAILWGDNPPEHLTIDNAIEQSRDRVLNPHRTESEKRSLEIIWGSDWEKIVYEHNKSRLINKNK